MTAPVFPVAAGYPSYTGTMIPEVWSPKLLYKFYLATVFAEIANTDYEGEITDQGDTVHIRNTPDITINDYVKGQELEFETPQVTITDLLINKGKSWSWKDDDVDRKQANYAYSADWSDDAAMQMKIKIDSGILGDVYNDGHSSNSGLTAGLKSSSFNLGVSGTPLRLTKDNVIDFIQDCGTVLDEQSVPEDNRWFVLPPWIVNLIGKSDLKDASLSGDAVSISRNGRVGMIDRFTLYRSNQLTLTTDGSNSVTNTMFGHPTALTFASQLTKSQGPMQDVKFFGDFYRGLNVYGYKVTKPEALGWGYVYK